MAEVSGLQIWAVRGAESPGWFDVCLKTSAWDVMHEWACCCDEAANHQLPIGVAFWINGIVSVEECSNLMQNLKQIHCSTCCSVIVNAMATQYTYSLNSISHPLLTSTVKSSLFTHAYSSPISLVASLHPCHTNLSHYIYNALTFSRQTLYEIFLHFLIFTKYLKTTY